MASHRNTSKSGCDGEPDKASLSQTHSENSSSGRMLDGGEGERKMRRDGGRERGDDVRGRGKKESNEDEP